MRSDHISYDMTVHLNNRFVNCFGISMRQKGESLVTYIPSAPLSLWLFSTQPIQCYKTETRDTFWISLQLIVVLCAHTLTYRESEQSVAPDAQVECFQLTIIIPSIQKEHVLSPFHHVCMWIKNSAIYAAFFVLIHPKFFFLPLFVFTWLIIIARGEHVWLFFKWKS